MRGRDLIDLVARTSGRKNGKKREKMNRQERERETTFVSTAVPSVCAGTVFKFGVSQSTVYKLDYDFLKNKLGISNLDNVDPRTIRLFGNGGKMVPERAGDPRPDAAIPARHQNTHASPR